MQMSIYVTAYANSTDMIDYYDQQVAADVAANKLLDNEMSIVKNKILKKSNKPDQARGLAVSGSIDKEQFC